jgi:predicted membrane metal-binding protein
MNDVLQPSLKADFAEPKIGSERNFGLVFAAMFALVALSPLAHGHDVRIWPLPIAVAFLCAAVLLPRALAPLNQLWFRLGLLLGKFVTPLVMTVLFFVTVTPVGVLMRAAGKDPLRLKWQPGAKTYWVERPEPAPKPASLQDQF